MAVDRNPDVMEMVEEELRDNPDISNKDLKLKAEEIDEDIADLSARQFNARYPLQVKRKMSAEEKAAEDGGAREAEETTSEEEIKEQVFEMIEKALREDPDTANEELQERAAEIDPSIADLSARSFNARYPLQVRRQMSADQKAEEEGNQKEETTVQETDTEELRVELRDTLIEFAKDVAGAEDRGKVIDVLTSVDEYVDRVMEKA